MSDERPRRSDATRAAILEAARSRFAAEGFRRATIRAIATDAGIDPSMVMRYYGSKDGLFAAAVDLDLRLPDLGAIDADALGAALVRQFLLLWEEPPNNEVLLTLLRSSVTEGAEPVLDRFRQVFAEQVTPAVLRVGDPAEAPRRAGLVVSQLLGLALCRFVLRIPPLTAMTREELIADVGRTVQNYLTAAR